MAKSKKQSKSGRPTALNQKEFEKKLEEYLSSRQDEVEIVEDNKGRTAVRLKVKLPTVEGLASHLGVVKKTIYNWASFSPEVKRGLERLKYEQFQRLVDNGLSGHYNSTITKLILSSNHGMREETKTTVDGSITGKFDEKQISRIAERILASRRGSNGNPSGEEKFN